MDPNPWIIRRDEIDLLEEELDQIYRVHQSETDETRFLLEEDILREQIETEEQSDAAYLLQTGLGLLQQEQRSPSLHTPPAHTHSHQHEDMPLNTRIHQRFQKEPLYQQAHQFAKALATFAREQYRSGRCVHPAMYRLYVNAYLVPIKLSFALGDLAEDAMARPLIEKEFALAGTYLDRLLSSLEQLFPEEIPEAHTFFAQGTRLRRAMEQHASQQRRQRPFSI